MPVVEGDPDVSCCVEIKGVGCVEVAELPLRKRVVPPTVRDVDERPGDEKGDLPKQILGQIFGDRHPNACTQSKYAVAILEDGIGVSVQAAAILGSQFRAE